MSPNDATMRLILEFEVGGGEVYYNRLLRFPTWPGEASGVTICVGYDFGYNTLSTIRSNWSTHLDGASVERLVRCAGKTGLAARDTLPSVRDANVP